MTIRVQGPDGAIAEFPDGTPPAAIKAAMGKRYGAPQIARGRSALFDKADAFTRGIADTLSLGGMDELTAAAYAPIGATVDAVRGRGFDLGRAYDRQLGRERATDRYDQQNAPIARGAGQLAGAVALPGGALSGSSRVGTRMAANFAQGAAYGFGSGEGGVRNRLVNAGQDGAAAAIGSEAGRVLLKVAGSALRGAQRMPAAQRLRDAGVRLTVAQEVGGLAKRLEDRLSGLGIVGDPVRDARREGLTSLMEAAGNQALAPIGGRVAPGAMTGRAVAADVLDQAGDAYSSAVSGMRAVADPQMTMDVLRARADPAVAQLIDDELIPRMNPATGAIDGRSLQEVKEILDSEARKWMNAPGGRRTGQAIRGLREDLLGAGARQSPAAAAAYGKARAAYGMAKTVARASAKSTSDGIATPRQLGQAIREGARRFGPRDAYARGEAPMQQLADDAATVLPSAVPDPGTAGQIAFGDLFKRPGQLGLTGVTGALYSPLGQSLLRAALINRPDVVNRAGAGMVRISAPFGAPIGLLTAAEVGQ